MPGSPVAPPPGAFVGIYGKIPAAGDFVRRGLPGALVAQLQDWLQDGLAALAERNNGDLDPVLQRAGAWRFAAGAGVLAPSCVMGVMKPSRDKVGRLYPCIALRTSADLEVEGALRSTAWYADLEAILGDEGRDAEALFTALAALGAPSEGAPLTPMNVQALKSGLLVTIEAQTDALGQSLESAQQILPVTPQMSVWWRGELPRVRLLMAIGLPRGDAFEALFADPELASLEASAPILQPGLEESS